MTKSIGELRAERHDVRMVHLGLGAFHRSHQAWYTQRANVESVGHTWGIAAFTGRSPAAARALNAQNDLYTLVERHAGGDSAHVIDVISSANDGASDAWTRAVAQAPVAVITTTITEAGYSGHAPTRIAEALAARRLAEAGPLTVVACDNMPDNGVLLRDRVTASCDADTARWIAANVAFVSSVVDRITPATTPEDIETVRGLIGVQDNCPVVAEPYSEWILSGDFPAGRPHWEAGGARFVEDIRPFEERKLWLLNAGHSMLAYAGLLRGLRTVDEAFADPILRDRLEALWAEQRESIPLGAAEIDGWLDGLRIRFENPRISHSLQQISRDGSFKLGPRILEPILRRQEAGESAGDQQLGVLADWITVVNVLGPTDDYSRGLTAEGGPRSSPASRAHAALELLTTRKAQQ
jgi:fructuronate reductase